MSSDHFVSFDPARVLVADDDPILREFAAVHLATPNVEIETVEDGIAALERLKAGGIDIALVDLDMPRLNGFEVIEQVRSDAALGHLPLVVVTGREDMLAIDRAFSLGATSFVVKPLNWRLLSHQLAYVLRNARAEARLRQQLIKLKAMNGVKNDILNLSQEKLAQARQLIINTTGNPASGTDGEGYPSKASSLKGIADGLDQLKNEIDTAANLMRTQSRF